jgi:hypothetical protein
METIIPWRLAYETTRKLLLPSESRFLMAKAIRNDINSKGKECKTLRSLYRFSTAG